MVLLFSKNTVQIFAMETSVKLPVETVLEGQKPLHPETFVVEMRALTEYAPMPEKSDNQQISIEIQGQDKKEFPPITFTQPGIYQYEIKQKKGNGKYYIYDSCIYHVTVYCTVDSMHGLEISVVALQQGKEDIKKDAVRFVNRYEIPKTSGQQSENVKTGDTAAIEMLLYILLGSGVMFMYFVLKRHIGKEKID